ncbi:hypothetical protein JTB14_025333 [Gonioctena quinquepunctata]|nr:hypothetical protein JTB14_025333 [Gonioctena quinquepunctata]
MAKVIATADSTAEYTIEEDVRSRHMHSLLVQENHISSTSTNTGDELDEIEIEMQSQFNRMDDRLQQWLSLDRQQRFEFDMMNNLNVQDISDSDSTITGEDIGSDHENNEADYDSDATIELNLD